MNSGPEGRRWWESRREGEPTAEFLCRVLTELGAVELAERARVFHYDDFRCPDEVDDGAHSWR